MSRITRKTKIGMLLEKGLEESETETSLVFFQTTLDLMSKLNSKFEQI